MHYDNRIKIEGLDFNTNSINYCSLQQHVDELIVLHQLFFKDYDNIKEVLFEEWIKDVYIQNEMSYTDTGDELYYDVSPHNCDKCENNWIIKINYKYGDGMFTIRI